MPNKAAKRRRARAERKAANQPQRRPARRSAFERYRRVGGYSAFLLSGLAFISAALLWSPLSNDPIATQAEAIGPEAPLDAAAALQPAFNGALPPLMHIASPEALPTIASIASQSSAQQLAASLETA